MTEINPIIFTKGMLAAKNMPEILDEKEENSIHVGMTQPEPTEANYDIVYAISALHQDDEDTSEGSSIISQNDFEIAKEIFKTPKENLNPIEQMDVILDYLRDLGVEITEDTINSVLGDENVVDLLGITGEAENFKRDILISQGIAVPDQDCNMQGISYISNAVKNGVIDKCGNDRSSKNMGVYQYDDGCLKILIPLKDGSSAIYTTKKNDEEYVFQSYQTYTNKDNSIPIINLDNNGITKTKAGAEAKVNINTESWNNSDIDPNESEVYASFSGENFNGINIELSKLENKIINDDALGTAKTVTGKNMDSPTLTILNDGTFIIQGQYADETTKTYHFDSDGNLLRRQTAGKDIEYTQLGIDARPEIAERIGYTTISEECEYVSFEDLGETGVIVNEAAENGNTNKYLYKKNSEGIYEGNPIGDEQGLTKYGLEVGEENTPERKLYEILAAREDNEGLLNDEARYEYDKEAGIWTITKGDKIYSLDTSDEEAIPVLLEDENGLTSEGLKNDSNTAELYNIMNEFGCEYSDNARFDENGNLTQGTIKIDDVELNAERTISFSKNTTEDEETTPQEKIITFTSTNKENSSFLYDGNSTYTLGDIGELDDTVEIQIEYGEVATNEAEETSEETPEHVPTKITIGDNIYGYTKGENPPTTLYKDTDGWTLAGIGIDTEDTETEGTPAYILSQAGITLDENTRFISENSREFIINQNGNTYNFNYSEGKIWYVETVVDSTKNTQIEFYDTANDHKYTPTTDSSFYNSYKENASVNKLWDDETIPYDVKLKIFENRFGGHPELLSLEKGINVNSTYTTVYTYNQQYYTEELSRILTNKNYTIEDVINFTREYSKLSENSDAMALDLAYSTETQQLLLEKLVEDPEKAAEFNEIILFDKILSNTENVYLEAEHGNYETLAIAYLKLFNNPPENYKHDLGYGNNKEQLETTAREKDEANKGEERPILQYIMLSECSTQDGTLNNSQAKFLINANYHKTYQPVNNTEKYIPTEDELYNPYLINDQMTLMYEAGVFGIKHYDKNEWDKQVLIMLNPFNK